VSEPVLQQTANTSVLVKEFGDRKESKKEVSVERSFAAYARVNICEAYENRVGHAIPGND